MYRSFKSPNIIRKKSAKSLLDKIRFYNPILVEQGEMVSKELLRVAILWHEMWYEALIEASRLFWDKSRNVNAMVARLKPLYDLLLSNNNNSNHPQKIEEEKSQKDVDDDCDKDDEDNPNDKNIANKRTLREQAFEDAFKFDLLTAWELVKQYQKTKNERDMLQAWDYYRRVYNKIDQQFDKLRDLDLQYVSKSCNAWNI